MSARNKKPKRKRTRLKKLLTRERIIQAIQVIGVFVEVGLFVVRFASRKINKSMEAEAENCNDCDTLVYPEDPYFATPCGTFCSRCIRKHAKGCEICADEFDL
jgi:hypothetical protein